MRNGDWLQTYPTGTQFWPLDPRPEEICIEDIATALSNLCRFGGHVGRLYSVGQHSILVSGHCLRSNALAGLLHDATEAYLVDVPRPIKPWLQGYKLIEERLAVAIGQRFGVTLHPLPDDVKLQDEAALATEKRDLLKPAPAPWGDRQGGLAKTWEDTVVRPWPAEVVRRQFLRIAEEHGIKVRWELAGGF